MLRDHESGRRVESINVHTYTGLQLISHLETTDEIIKKMQAEHALLGSDDETELNTQLELMYLSLFYKRVAIFAEQKQLTERRYASAYDLSLYLGESDASALFFVLDQLMQTMADLRNKFFVIKGTHQLSLSPKDAQDMLTVTYDKITFLMAVHKKENERLDRRIKQLQDDKNKDLLKNFKPMPDMQSLMKRINKAFQIASEFVFEALEIPKPSVRF